MKNRSKVIISDRRGGGSRGGGLFRRALPHHPSRRRLLRHPPAGYADIASSVHETGTVNPVNQVAVGSEVSGTVRTLHADFNDRVKTGQVAIRSL